MDPVGGRGLDFRLQGPDLDPTPERTPSDVLID